MCEKQVHLKLLVIIEPLHFYYNVFFYKFSVFFFRQIFSLLLQMKF